MVQNFFFGFAGLVTAAAAWSIWGQDLFPAAEDPKGDPENWSEVEMERWLNNVIKLSRSRKGNTRLTRTTERPPADWQGNEGGAARKSASEPESTEDLRGVLCTHKL